jgi:hypothetical protein
MTKMEALREVKLSLTSLLCKLEVHIFTEDVENILEKQEKVSKSFIVEEIK